MGGYSKIKATGTHDGKFHGETVVIYLWGSRANLETEGKSVGHAAAEILINGVRGSKSKNTYISASPDLGGRVFGREHAATPHPVMFPEDLEEDIDPKGVFEGRKPDFVFILHTLQKRIQMVAAAKKILEERQTWTRLDNNCVSDVVYKLLVAGAFEYPIESEKFKLIVGASEKGSEATSKAPASQLVNKCAQSGAYTSAISAGVAAEILYSDYLFELLKEAKKKEIERISRDSRMQDLAGMVLQFEFDDGTIITEWTPQHSSNFQNLKSMTLRMLIILPISILMYYFFKYDTNFS